MTSINQPRASTASSRRKSVFFHCASTSSFGCGWPFFTMKISRNLIQQDVAADPAGTTRRRCERLSDYDDFAHKELLGNDEQAYDAQLFQIVVQQKEVRVVARYQTLAHGAECAIEHPVTERALLAFQFIFFVAQGAEKIRNRPVQLKLTYLRASAVWTEDLLPDPPFCPSPSSLRSARVRSLGLVKLQLHKGLSPVGCP